MERNIWTDPAAAARVRAATGGSETVPTVVIGSRALVNPSAALVVEVMRTEFGEDAESLISAQARRPRPAWADVAAWTALIVLVWTMLATAVSTAPGSAQVTTGVCLALAWAAGVDRLLRRTTAASAWVGEHRVAASEEVLTVGGNAYFPLTSVTDGVLTKSATWTVCPWKGLARYYDVTVTGTAGAGSTRLLDAAWSYPHPLPLSRRLKDRVAFRDEVDIRR